VEGDSSQMAIPAHHICFLNMLKIPTRSRHRQTFACILFPLALHNQ